MTRQEKQGEGKKKEDVEKDSVSAALAEWTGELEHQHA